MTDRDVTPPPLLASIGSRFTRRNLLLSAGAGAIGIALSRPVSGSDDDDEDHDKSHDDAHDKGNDRDDYHVLPSGTVQLGSAEVVIDDDDADGFEPGTITIDAGQSVTWINLDDDPHTATGANFDTGVLQPGELATVTFDDPGVFPYSCQVHPIMTGVVEVRDETGAVPVTNATAGASPAASPQAGSRAEVDIDNLEFMPADLTVPVGTTVVWTNREVIPHTVRSTSGAFDSGIMEQGDVFEYTFTGDSVFDYICGLHPSMEGHVTVEG